ncbi:MAG: hypothetical protein LUH04_06145 [Clostridium sp.]|nr:hypothetical protein [Clostridium sp.]
MLQKYAAALILSLALLCGASYAGTEAETQAEAMAQAMAMLGNQPPMTQADIDSYIVMAPQIVNMANDPNAVMKLYQDNNVSPERFAVVSTKVAIGVSMGQGVTREMVAASGQVPEFMMPDATEEDLIKANMDALLKAMGM